MDVCSISKSLRNGALLSFSLLHLFLSLASGISNEVPPRPKNMKEILEKSKIIPDVIDEAPRHHIMVEYFQRTFINFGNMMPPDSVYWRTFAIEWFCYREQWFTFLLTGPDEPSRENPTDREFIHWLVVNVPIDAVICGDDRIEYVPPRPQEGTGLHRYVFIAFHQTQGKMNFTEPKWTNASITERKRWSTRKFAKKYGFKEVHAINYFTSEWYNPHTTTPDIFDI